jgi:hypothetical protein
MFITGHIFIIQQISSQNETTMLQDTTDKALQNYKKYRPQIN